VKYNLLLEIFCHYSIFEFNYKPRVYRFILVGLLLPLKAQIKEFTPFSLFLVSRSIINVYLQSILKGVGKRPEKRPQRTNVCFHKEESEIIGYDGGDVSSGEEDFDTPDGNNSDLPDHSCELNVIYTIVMLVIILN